MTKPIVTDHPLSQTEQSVLRTLAGMIVPASIEYQVPGANDEIIFADIIQSSREAADIIRSGIAYATTTAAERDLEAISAELEGQAVLAPLVSLVLQCYYRDDRVMEALGMEARPPFPKGYEVEQGDWSMLEPVQQRGKIWRDA